LRRLVRSWRKLTLVALAFEKSRASAGNIAKLKAR
jgi:hypothetical protein